MRAAPRRLFTATTVLGLLTAGLLGGGAPAQAAPPGSGTAYVVHGIVGETLDVYVDDREVASAATAKTVVGPLRLPAGAHAVSLRKGASIVAEASFTVRAGRSCHLVAHRRSDADRAPTLTVYPNDTSPVGPGKVRLVVAHTAAVPPADVLADGDVLIRNLANGEAYTAIVPATAYSISMVPTGRTGPALLGPVTLSPPAGTLTHVFAISDPATGVMDAIVQSLPVPVEGAGTPSDVDTGNGGQAAAAATGPAGASAVPLGLFGALLLVLLAGAAVRGRAVGTRR